MHDCVEGGHHRVRMSDVRRVALQSWPVGQPASHLKATRERATPIQKFCCSSSVVVSHRVHQPPWLSLRLLRAHLSEGEKRERERELTSVAIDARLSCLSSNPGGPDYTPGRRRRRRWPSRALRRRRRQQVSAHRRRRRLLPEGELQRARAIGAYQESGRATCRVVLRDAVCGANSSPTAGCPVVGRQPGRVYIGTRSI